MTVNKHGLKMKGLKSISGETKSLRGFYSGEYLELFYDKSNGETWTNYKYSLAHNTWTEYLDVNIIHICNLYVPTTMQELADKIADKIEQDNYIRGM